MKHQEHFNYDHTLIISKTSKNKTSFGEWKKNDLFIGSTKVQFNLGEMAHKFIPLALGSYLLICSTSQYFFLSHDGTFLCIICLS